MAESVGYNDGLLYFLLVFGFFVGGCSSLKSEPNEVKSVFVERGEGVLHDYVILHHFWFVYTQNTAFLELV